MDSSMTGGLSGKVLEYSNILMLIVLILIKTRMNVLV